MTKIFNELLFVLSAGLCLLSLQFLSVDGVHAIPSLEGGLEWRSCPYDKPIKGNINYYSGTKIYHKPNTSFYKKTNPEVCFATSMEAEIAGFRASKNNKK
ncbi:MAG: hypothetical protein QNJ31_07425 [Candidatus Caenarcaniphilales bacterium]|nr:hypothetical protein [Candidatus Caenarcaniphilales bacterium]